MVRNAVDWRRRALACVATLWGILCATPTRGYLPPPYGGTVVAPLPDDPLTLDPVEVSRFSELQLCDLLYDTLYRRNRTGQVVPHLAAAAPTAGPAGAMRLMLRRGVRWHDGQPLTAEQVAAALQRLQGGANGYLLSAVEKISAATDEITIEGRLSIDELISILSAPAAAIVARREGRLVGTGPFRLEKRGRRVIELRAHADHFAGRPYLERLVFKRFARRSAEVASFQVGATQISLHGVSVFGGTPRYEAREAVTEPLATAFVAVGNSRPLYGEPLFRLALQLAIDRQRLRRLAGTGPTVLAEGPVAPRLLRGGSFGRSFDRAMARRLLGRLARRHPTLAAGKRLPVALMIDASRFDDRPIADQVVADLDRVGIAARIDARSAADYQSRLSRGAFDLAIGRLVPPLPEGRLAVAAALAAVGRIDEARTCMATRRCGAREARRFARQLHFVPLVHVASKIHYDARLGALQPGPAGRLPYAALYWRRKR